MPDLAAFRAIVAEVADLRTRLGLGQPGANRVTTTGVPLGTHPGLVDATTRGNVRQEMKAFLERHLSDQHLSAMAIMGLPAGASAPWIFLAMTKLPPGLVPALPNGGFVPVHGPALDGEQFAEKLNPVGASPRVVPLPHPNNRSPITCMNAALPVPGPPLAERRGSSTAGFSPTSRLRPRPYGTLLILWPIRPGAISSIQMCVSCHTDTRRAMDLLQVSNIPGIEAAVLPKGQYNVRNFGWSPPGEGSIQGTVTCRTAAETTSAVNFINAQMLGR